MPKYLIELTDGRKFQVEADRQPTEAEVLAQLSASAPPAEGDQLLENVANVGRFAGNVAIGAGKGAAATATRLGQAVHQIPGVSRAVDWLYGQPGLSAASFPAAQAALVPEGAGQQIGHGVEQAAEYLLPGKGVTTAARGLNLAGRMAAEGALGLGMAGAQGTSPTVGVIGGAAGPVIGRVLAPLTRGVRPSEAGQARGVAYALAHPDLEMNIGTATGKPFLEGTQRLVDRGFVGSHISDPAQARTLAAAEAHGTGELAARTGVARPVSREKAGDTVLEGVTQTRDAIRAVAKEHYSDAEMYAALSDPQWVPTPDVLTPERIARMRNSLGGEVPTIEQLQELRRIREELAALGHSQARTSTEDVGLPTMRSTYHARSAGAPVYHEIMQLAPGTSSKTRDEVLKAVDQALATGRFTDAAVGALEVVKKRMAPGAYAAGRAMLPPSAGLLPPTEMIAPVDVSKAKAALRGEYERQSRVLASTRAQANPAQKMLAELMEGPDVISLMDADQNLGRMKTIQRGGKQVADAAALKDPSQRLGTQMTRALAPLVDDAAKQVPHLQESLEQARGAYREIFPVEKLRARLAAKEGGVQRYRTLVRNDDEAIGRLRHVQTSAPTVIPQVARARLDELMEIAFEHGKPGIALRNWQRMGPETKRILYAPEHAQDIEAFLQFAVARAKNVNPSGTATTLTQGAELGSLGASLGTLLGLWQAGPGGKVAAGAALGGSGAAGLTSYLMNKPSIARLMAQGARLPNTDVARAAWLSTLQQAVADDLKSED